MSDKFINSKPPYFYIKDLRDNSVWEVNEIDDREEQNRLGWLNCICLDPGSNSKNYIGGPMGVDCGFVFLSGKWDYSKNKNFLP